MSVNKNLLCMMKWDEFNNFVVNGLSNMYQRDEMADVTLFCDGRSFRAHKVLLSIWSPYFKEIFAATTHPNPVIILRDTTVSDLELILRFIYQGELFVPYEDADRFLKTAEHFQVAGLRSMRINHIPSQVQANNSVVLSPSTPLPNNISSIEGNSSSSSRVQSFGSSGTSFSPILISSSSSTPGIPFNQNHSNINPTYPGTVSENVTQNQLSSNVIRSHSRVLQVQTDPHIRTVTSPQSTTSSQGPSYHHNRNENILKQNQERLASQTTQSSVLIVHSPNHHNEYQNLRDHSHVGKTSETLVLLENVASTPSSQGTVLHQSVNSSGAYSTVYNNFVPHQTHSNTSVSGEEEILGLSYLTDNSRSQHQHSQIIQEAAIAAGVGSEESESSIVHPVQSEPTPPSSGSSRLHKADPIVLASSSNTPVYAVKRVSLEVVRNSSFSKPTATKQSKTKRNKNTLDQKRSSSTTNGSDSQNKIEFISCPKCKKSVKRSSLKVHMKRTHLEEGKILSCPICDKQISSKGVYYKHMYLHRQKSELNDSINNSEGSRTSTRTNRTSTASAK